MCIFRMSCCITEGIQKVPGVTVLVISVRLQSLENTSRSPLVSTERQHSHFLTHVSSTSTGARTRYSNQIFSLDWTHDLKLIFLRSKTDFFYLCLPLCKHGNDVVDTLFEGLLLCPRIMQTNGFLFTTWNVWKHWPFISKHKIIFKKN